MMDPLDPLKMIIITDKEKMSRKVRSLKKKGYEIIKVHIITDKNVYIVAEKIIMPKKD